MTEFSPDHGATQTLKPGLYVVATPIGNLRDITLRALDVLNAAAVIYAEDTRVTGHLLSFYGIKTAVKRCDAYTEQDAVDDIVAAINKGLVVALVSDAGTPGISDPGAHLVAAVRAYNIDVFPVAGPCAAVAALSAAGLTAPHFLFLGFLPNKSAARRAVLREHETLDAILVVYESPGRVADTLADIAAIMGDRDVVIAREISKRFETFYSGSASELLRDMGDDALRGEVVMLVAPGAGRRTTWDDAAVDARLMELLANMSLKEAVANVTAQSGRPRRDIYARALALDRKG